MFIYNVTAHSTYYAVTVELDPTREAFVPATDADILFFAMGAASMRDGGMVGDAGIATRVPATGDKGEQVVVYVNCLDPEGTRN